MTRKTTYEHLIEAGDLSTATYGDWPIWQHCVPFPSKVMMGTSGTPQLDIYLAVGSAWWHVVSHYLPENARVLDIGCGCAKLARFFATDTRVQHYVGFDPISSCIEWNRRFVLPIVHAIREHGAEGRERIFEFIHIDLYSAEYNPNGRILASSLQFPAEHQSIDVVVASSVFTHLLEADAQQYLAQTARVLKPTGRLILSVHDEPANGALYSGDEARIDVDVSYFAKLAEQCGLSLHSDLGSLCGQRALVFSRGSSHGQSEAQFGAHLLRSTRFS